MNATSNANLVSFLKSYENRLNEFKASQGYTYFDRYDVSIEILKRYIKVFANEIGGTPCGQRSRIVAFIDKNTGDIFKPATYKAPAKHARGNINSDKNGMEAVSVTGDIIYLK
jgi:hypothetical protein